MTGWIKSLSWLIFGLLLAATAGALVAWKAYQMGGNDTKVRYEAAIKTQKDEAARVLEVETTKVKTAEKALTDFKTNQEKTDAQNQAVTADYARRLRAAAGPTGRLRDPNAARCGNGSTGAPGASAASAAPGAADGASDAGFLSKQLTEFLLDQAASADQVNLAFASCKPMLQKIVEQGCQAK